MVEVQPANDPNPVKALRNLQSESNDAFFDLSEYIQFKVRRGDESSARTDKLGFSILTVGIQNDQILFRCAFDFPEMVSIGLQQDQFIAQIIKPTFFSSSDTGLSIKEDFVIIENLPRMFGISEYNSKVAIEAVNTGIQLGIIAQLAITLPIAISLKSMWNLMNIIQVLSYMRLYSNWPAMIDFQLNQLELAITMKPVSDLVMDFGKSKF